MIQEKKGVPSPKQGIREMQTNTKGKKWLRKAREQK